MSRIETLWKRRDDRGSWRSIPAALVAAAAVFTGIACDRVTETKKETEKGPAQVAVAARGSAETRVDISTLAQLRSMSLTGNYRLIKDITMAPTDAGFVPVGSPFAPFRGTFDGQTFAIKNFRTANNASPGWYRGLFAGTDGAILKNIHLQNVTVVGEAYTGAIAGYMNNTSLTDSYVNGSVSGLMNPNIPGYALGMMVGWAGSYTEIRRCYATGFIRGVVLSMGGLIGEIHSYGFRNLDDDPRVQVSEIFTNVDVEATPPGPDYDGTDVPTGGVVGLVNGAAIQDIYAVGRVKGRGSPGGIVGRVVNDDPGTMASELTQGVYIGDVMSTSGGARAGAIGSLSGDFLSGSRCAVFYNKDADGGVRLPTSTLSCNAGKTTQELKAPHPSPNKLLVPYIIGQLVDQAFINKFGPDWECKRASGSDGDWGFGTCATPIIWKANLGNQYNTLANINQSIQPL